MNPEILPQYELPLRREGTNIYVSDPLRKKEILLTPEEFVRQCLIRFLLEEKKVPAGLMSLERGVNFQSLKKRYDLVVFDRNGKTALLAECKAPEISLDEKAVRQLSTYNSSLNARYLLLANGPSLLIFARKENEKYEQLVRLPVFSEW